MKAGCLRLGLLIFLVLFTTKIIAAQTPPFSVTTNDATSVTASSAEMHGAISAGTGPTGAWFEWGTSTSFGSRTDIQVFSDGSAAITFVQSIRNLQPHTTYYFRAVGYRSGTSIPGETKSFTTSGDASPITSLTATTSSATSITSNSAVFNGSLNSGNGATTVWFNWGTTTSLGTRTDAQSFNGTTTVPVAQTLHNLQPHTTYYFRIEAYRSSDGAGSVGAVKTFTTADAPVTSITATTTDATSIGGTSAELHGAIAGGNGTLAGWFEWGTTTSLGTRTDAQVFTDGRSVAMSQRLSNLRPGTTYYFRLVVYPAIAGAPNVFGEIKTFTTTSDSPSGLSITSISAAEITNSSAQLRAAVNTGANAATGWFEWGTTTALSNHSDVQSLGTGMAVTLAQTLKNLAPRTTYFFRAVASSGSVTVRSDVRSFTTTGDAIAPFAVMTLDASAVSSASAELRGLLNTAGAPATAWFEWGPSTPLGNQTTPQNINASSIVSSFAYSLTNLQPNTTYYFRAVAQNASATVRGDVRSFTTTRVPSTVPQPNPDVERGITRSGYVVITPGEASAAPTPTVTFGTVSEGSIVSQAGLVPAPMASDASMFVEVIPSISRSIGVALANPGASPNGITMTLRDEDGLIVGSPVVVTVPARQQVAKFLQDMFGADTVGSGFRGSVRMQSATAFAAIGVRFSGSIFSTLPVAVTTPVAGVPTRTLTAGTAPDTPQPGTIGSATALIVPQFAISGGWATQIALVNNAGSTIVGRVDFFDIDGNPMAVPLNGDTRSTFTYEIPIGGTFVLAPRDSNGQSPF
jgi:phosphodiesterase/alkaline phosphatase D-like protein